MEEGDSGRIPVIKIKIPKKAEEEEGVPSHYCKECDRSFSSGKALGGHMSSAHVQANKEYSMRKAMSFNSKSKSSSPGSPCCSCGICGRVFQSQKSLFGHMRCHPERDWRGMEPPSTPRDAKSESSEELGFFSGKPWPTCKRGRPAVEKEKEKVDEVEEMFKVAVQVLARGKMEREYRCDTCGKVFKSHEALGGHRASHKKFKMSIINTSTRHLEPKKMPRTKKNKMMMTKPDFVTSDPGPSDHVDSNADSASASGFLIDIDLNMSPPEEEVEDKGIEDSWNDMR